MPTISLSDNRRNKFRCYLLERNPNTKFVQSYFLYLNSAIVKDAVRRFCSHDDIFKTGNIRIVEAIYEEVKKNDTNKRLHNVYSGAISAYLKFLQGKSLRPPVKRQRTIEDGD